MLNLLKMDLRRMFRGKSVYIFFGILVFITVFTFSLLFIIQDPEMQEFLTEHGMVITAESGNLKAVLNTKSLIQVYHQTNVSGGLLPVLAGILAVLFVCMDFDSGFIKNILSVHENKWNYILSKSFCLYVVNFFLIALTFLISLGLNVICRGFFSYGSGRDILFYILSIWMVVNGFTTLALVICVISRSKAAGITGAFLLGGGIIVMVLYSLLQIFGGEKIMNYTLYLNLAYCPMEYSGLSDLRPMIVGLVFCVIYMVIGKVVLAKKDI